MQVKKNNKINGNNNGKFVFGRTENFVEIMEKHWFSAFSTFPQRFQDLSFLGLLKVRVML